MRWATVAREQSEVDLALSGKKLQTGHRGSAPSSQGVPFPLRLSRPRGVGPGFPPSALSAHFAFLRAGGAVESAPRGGTRGSQNSFPFFPGL